MILGKRRKRAISVVVNGLAVLIVATAAAYATSDTGRTVDGATPPPALSSLGQYPAPFTMLAYVPAATGPGIQGILCAGSMFSDSRVSLFGWPLAYEYDSDDGCSGGSFYPLLFIADVLLFGTAMGGITYGAYRLLTQLKHRRPNL